MNITNNLNVTKTMEPKTNIPKVFRGGTNRIIIFIISKRLLAFGEIFNAWKKQIEYK